MLITRLFQGLLFNRTGRKSRRRHRRDIRSSCRSSKHLRQAQKRKKSCNLHPCCPGIYNLLCLHDNNPDNAVPDSSDGLRYCWTWFHRRRRIWGNWRFNRRGGIEQKEMSNSFLYLLLIQGLFTGLTIGKLGEARLKVCKALFALMVISLLFLPERILF